MCVRNSHASQAEELAADALRMQTLAVRTGSRWERVKVQLETRSSLPGEWRRLSLQ